MIVPLHVHSAYTLLQSPMSITEYVKTGKTYGYKALGLADINVLYGALEFYRLCLKNNIKPFIGMTVQLPTNVHGQPYEEWLIYVKNYAGYQDLMALSSLLKLTDNIDAEKMRDFIFNNNENWITILPALNGPHMNLIKQGSTDETMIYLESIKQYFKAQQLYIGIGNLAHELYHLGTIREITAKAKLTLVPLPHIKYAKSHDAFSLKILQAIDDNEVFTEASEFANIQGFNYLQTPQAYGAAYDELIANQDVMAVFTNLDEQCQFVLPDKEYLLPKFPIAENKTAQSYLKALAFAGLDKRIEHVTDDYIERLHYELSIIHEMGFDDYFLIVWDVIRFAHEKHIMTGPGRGSAAGALTAFCLQITDVDPIENHLLFERFLNPERQNMPDIDLDFPDNQRQHILDYVYNKYGEGHVAQIATFGSFAARMSLRNVGAILGKSQETLKEWANQIPRDPKASLQSVYNQSETLRQMIRQEENGELWFKTAGQLEGLPRHVSTHAAGVIISDQPLQKYTPLQSSGGHIPLSQYTMGDVEGVGLLKVDFLSLSNLTILNDAVKAAEKLAYKPLDPLSFDREDQEVYSLFRKAKTNGIFQFESEGIRNVLRQVAPTSMEDLAAVNALFRPGPMKQIDHFVERKHGREAIAYPHPDLADILKPTYGVMVYQEQVMQVANKLAGFSLGQADILRRAMGKKDKKIIDEMRQKFISGAVSQGYSQETAVQVYNYIDEFANYGFNRSHAFAYSYLAYQLAWLKTHYPVAFYYGNLINVHIHDTKGKQLIVEAKNQGLKILPPDVNHSFMDMQVIDVETIQLGLSDIKGISKNMSETIIQLRQSEGQYQDLQDFVNRIGERFQKKDLLEKLAKSNALASFDLNRRTLIEDAIDKMLEHTKLFGGNMQQLSLLSDEKNEYQRLFTPVIEKLDEYSDRKLMEDEIETLGQVLTVNLYEDYQVYYQEELLTHVSELKDNQKVGIIGEITHLKRITTKNGKPMAFIQLQDEVGIVEVTVFPDVYVQYAAVLHQGHQVYIYGKTQVRNDNLQLVMVSAKALNQELIQFLDNNLNRNLAKSTDINAYYIRVENRQTATDKKTDLLQIIQNNQGNLPIHFTLKAEEETFWLAKKFNVSSDISVSNGLKKVYGNSNVKIQ